MRAKSYKYERCTGDFSQMLYMRHTGVPEKQATLAHWDPMFLKHTGTRYKGNLIHTSLFSELFEKSYYVIIIKKLMESKYSNTVSALNDAFNFNA